MPPAIDSSDEEEMGTSSGEEDSGPSEDDDDDESDEESDVEARRKCRRRGRPGPAGRKGRNPYQMLQCPYEIWESNLARLVSFKAMLKHGHCLPRGWPDDPKLAGWVHMQVAAKRTPPAPGDHEGTGGQAGPA